MAEFLQGTDPRRSERARAIVDDVSRRRSSGELVSDLEVLAKHPDLADQLRIELQRLNRVDSAMSPAPTEGTHAEPTIAFTSRERTTGEAQSSSHGAAGAVAPGTMFGRYQIIAEIARGGMGIVYTARQTDLDRVVCLKVLHAGGATGDWLVREALVLAKFSHPNIVPIYDAGVIDGRYYYTMEYVEGRTLAQAIDGRPMDPKTAAHVALEIATALAYAHDRGVIHRDVKPRNVLISTRVAGGSMRAEDWRAAEVRVADFGLALPIGESSLGSTLQTGVVGTPRYMSPEQARGDRDSLDGRTDVYSLGVVLYEMLTGTPPLSNLPIKDLIRRVCDEKTALPLPSSVMPNVDQELELVCGKAMRKDRDDRYASAEEMADDLRRYLAGEKVLAKPDRTALRRTLKIAAAAATILAVLAAAATAVFDPLGLQGPTQIAWSEAPKHIGDRLEVELLGAYAVSRDKGLVLDPAPGDVSSFEVVVPADLMSSIPSKLDTQYQRQRLIARGLIESENGRPVIRLANSQDIRFERPLTSEERIESETRFARVHVPREDNVINWRDASKRVGDDVTVEGNVLSVGESDTALRINVGFLSRQSVAAVIFSEYLSNFGSDVNDAFTGKRVRVAGRIISRDGKPEVHVRLPAQLKVVGVASGEFETNGTPVPAEEAGAHLDKLVTVEGDVTSIGHAGSAFFINMGGKTGRSSFVAFIPAETEAQFPDGFESFYAGKRLQVTGEVYLHNGTPNIRLIHPYQVRVVGSSKENATPIETIPVSDVSDYVGQIKTVRGRVNEVARTASFAFVNFDGVAFKEGFYVFIPGSAFERMPDGFETFYPGREIHVTGEVQLHEGRPQIKITDKRQIFVVPRSQELRADPVAEGEAQVITPQDAPDHIGQRRTVSGRIGGVSRNERFAFINFEGLEGEKGLKIYVPGSVFSALPNGFDEFYVGRDVKITGTIQLHDGRPEIVVNDQRQISVLPRGGESPQPSDAEQPVPAANVVSPADAAKFIDQIVTVDAVVTNINRGERLAQMYFEGAGEDGFYVFIPASGIAKLPDGFDTFYAGKRLQVTGRIQLYKGRPQIVLTLASQIRVLHDEPDQSAPPSADTPDEQKAPAAETPASDEPAAEKPAPEEPAS